MSYYIWTTLKMSFREYNKFVKHCKDNLDDDIKNYYDLKDEDIENGDFIDKIFGNFEIDSDSISFNDSYKYKSYKDELIASYIEEASDDEESYEEFGYVSLGDDDTDVEVGGCIDDGPYITVDSNMKYDSKRLKDGCLKIIIY